ncbi:MAG: PH domain-containing protein [Planctomycetota bacterium]
MARRETVLRRAEFDPRLPTYFLIQALFGMTVTIVFLPVALVWLFVGPAIHRKQYENLSCELTDRALHVKRGFLFRVQQNIPLDKITDLSLAEGPILRRFGLCALRIETAGGGQATSMGQAMLFGVVDAEEFRDAVLEQRDAVVLEGAGAGGAMEVKRPTAPPPIERGDGTRRRTSARCVTRYGGATRCSATSSNS